MGSTLGRLLIAADHTDDARQVLDDSRAAATTIGSADLVRDIDELLGNLPDERDEET